MRIVQIIDSLQVGGAERMAVNYANALSEKIDFSGLIATRKEGSLKSQLASKADYLFLDKKMAIDFAAIFRLRAYCKKNSIDVVHAHGTSFFIAFLLKIFHPSVKIVWHEHKGARSTESLRENRFLSFCSKYFSGIIVVDHALENWCLTTLNFKKVIYLPNFTLFNTVEKKITRLKGEADKRIVCLANLRFPKNHSLLIEVAAKIKQKYPGWTFHLVGNDFDDTYSKSLKQMIINHSLEETVYIYGLKEDTAHIIEQSEIGILTSLSEGLPVALLEYGLYGKAVIATNVGEIPLIIEDGISGLTVPSQNAALFAEALEKAIDNPTLRRNFGEALRYKIKIKHSQEAVIQEYLNWLKKI